MQLTKFQPENPECLCQPYLVRTKMRSSHKGLGGNPQWQESPQGLTERRQQRRDTHQPSRRSAASAESAAEEVRLPPARQKLLPQQRPILSLLFNTRPYWLLCVLASAHAANLLARKVLDVDLYLVACSSSHTESSKCQIELPTVIRPAGQPVLNELQMRLL